MKILKVNMTEGKIDSMPVPEGKALGGRGMISHLMTEYGSATAHPLSPEALFIAAIGVLGGSSAPNAHRISVGGKSPLTGGIKEANAGGVAAHKLGRLGIQALMVEGKSDEWQVLKLNAEGASLEPAGDIVGMKNYAAWRRCWRTNRKASRAPRCATSSPSPTSRRSFPAWPMRPN